MNSALKKNSVAAINDQWIKGVIDMVMGYENKSFLYLMNWLYVSYVQIIPGDLISNQGEMQATYNVKYPIEILFVQMETGQ